MRAEMQYLISCSVFKAVWWLRRCRPNSCSNWPASRSARPSWTRRFKTWTRPASPAYASRPGHRLSCGAILTTGASWGDLLITSQLLRDMRLAKALGYCEVVVLTKSRLEEESTNFPMSAQLIREAGLKLATQRWSSQCTQLRPQDARCRPSSGQESQRQHFSDGSRLSGGDV